MVLPDVWYEIMSVHFQGISDVTVISVMREKKIRSKVTDLSRKENKFSGEISHDFSLWNTAISQGDLGNLSSKTSETVRHTHWNALPLHGRSKVTSTYIKKWPSVLELITTGLTNFKKPTNRKLAGFRTKKESVMQNKQETETLFPTCRSSNYSRTIGTIPIQFKDLRGAGPIEHQKEKSV